MRDKNYRNFISLRTIRNLISSRVIGSWDDGSFKHKGRKLFYWYDDMWGKDLFICFNENDKPYYCLGEI